MLGLRKAKNWLLRWEWIILVSFAIIAFVMGFIGYWHVLQAQSLPFSLSLIIYWTFQLFVLNVTFTPDQTNVLVEIARFLAPGLFFFAAFKAGWQILRSQIEGARIKRLKGHVIICGAGEKGFILAEQFRNNKENVVVIDLDAGNGFLQQCKEKGTYTLIGNVNDKQVLLNAGIEQATYLFAVCGDDGINAQIWVSVFETDQIKKRKKPLHCYIHIANVPIYENLREQEFMYYTKPPIPLPNKETSHVVHEGSWACLHFFNTYENSAIKLLSLFPVDVDEQGEPHIMVIGLGNLAESFVIQAIKNWHNDQQKADSKRTLSVTIVDPNATSKTMLWNMRYPSLTTNCKIVSLDFGTESVEFHSIFEKIDIKPLTKIYICKEDDVEGVTAALIMHQKIREVKGKRIILCTPHEKGISQMISRVTSSGERVNPILVFGFLKESCNKDLIMASDIDLLAQALHHGYLTIQQTKFHKEMGSEAVMHNWSELEYEHREENYRQAHSIHEMLLSQNYGIKPRSNWDEPPIEFLIEDIDILCKKEHENWKLSREQQGWSWGEVRDDNKKRNPLLKGWDELNETEKETTRETIRHLPGYLAKTNYNIYKINSEISPKS